MLKRQKEVLQYQLDSEEAILKALEKHYRDALEDINMAIRIMQTDELTQSKIYRINYQQALKKQVEGILEKLHSDEYTTLQQFLSSTYTDAFVGTMYDLHAQKVPVIIPVDRKAAVKAVLTDSKLTSPLYDELGIDINGLKKTIRAEITRGIASGMTYDDIARNISSMSKAPLSRAKTIARTEGHRIQQASTDDARMAAKARGADVVKQWDSTMDGATRPVHRELDGQIREVDEPFEAHGKKAMYPGAFNDPAEDCNCRCAALTRARKALDADELKVLQERAKFFGLDKSKDFEDFKKKYQEAAGRKADKVYTVEEISKKGTEALLDAYDDRRIHFDLNEVPAEELRKNRMNPVAADYTGLSVQTADAFNEVITKLSNEYYTGFTRIEVADPKKTFGAREFASTRSVNSVAQKTLVINPLKTKDFDQMVDRIEELSRNGYAVELAKGKAREYVATHEFAHSLLDIGGGSLKNYVGLDTKLMGKARKEIESVFAKYVRDVGELERAFKAAEKKMMLAETVDEMTALQSETLMLRTQLKQAKISTYSMQNADEFMAEAFTQARIGTQQSPYTAEVMAILDKYFRK